MTLPLYTRRHCKVCSEAHDFSLVDSRAHAPAYAGKGCGTPWYPSAAEAYALQAPRAPLGGPLPIAAACGATCIAPAPGVPDVRCELRSGHTGSHRAGDIEWFAREAVEAGRAERDTLGARLPPPEAMHGAADAFGGQDTPGSPAAATLGQLSPADVMHTALANPSDEIARLRRALATCVRELDALRKRVRRTLEQAIQELEG